MRRLNLTWQVIVPEDGKRWGTAYPNKTISGGILKYLYEGEADIGFCSLWIERSKFPYMIMSTYWNILCLRFLVPKPKVMSNHLRTIFKPLPLNLWIMIFLSTILTTAVSTVLRYIQRLIKPNYYEGKSIVHLKIKCMQLSTTIYITAKKSYHKRSFRLFMKSCYRNQHNIFIHHHHWHLSNGEKFK